jgi:hypothetical protein
MNVWFHDQPPLLAKYSSNVFASGDVPANTSVRRRGLLRQETGPRSLLCHESCRVSGETFLAGGRRHARLFLAETEGYIHPGADLTPEAVAEHWAQIMDVSDFYVPADTGSWLATNAEWIAASPTVSPA